MDTLVLFLAIIWLLLQTSVVQNIIVREVALKLSKNIHASVTIKNVDIEFFDKMKIENTLIMDQKRDTLLYAHAIKVNISDWFFWKDNIVLKYIGLDDAEIHLNRKDSIWNYQFLLNYFKSPSKKEDTSKNVIKLDLKTISLNNVKILQEDSWNGENLRFTVGKLQMDTKQFDMKQKKINIRSLTLEQPQFAQFDYDGKYHPDTTNKKIIQIQSNDGNLKWNDENWELRIDKINIKDGNIAIENYTHRPIYTNQFDDQHILFNSLNGTMNNVSFIKDTILANIKLKAKNRSGFELKKLTANFKFTPTIMEFKNLDILTNRSHITNYYSMSYNDFNGDMNNFITAVKLNGNFKNSTINSDDIAYFAPELKKWKRSFTLTGTASGTIDNLKAEHVILNGSNTKFNGDVIIKGLPDIEKTFFNFRIDKLFTNFNEVSVFIPEVRTLLQPDLHALGNIDFNGSFIGNLTDFSTSGTLISQLGTISTTLKMKLPSRGSPVYSGLVSAIDFDLGNFIHEKSLGKINFSGKINGTGFEDKNMALKIDGIIKSLYFNNYTYQNISALGLLKNKGFEGSAFINDPNLDVPMALGSIDFSRKLPQFKLYASVNNVNLKRLNLTNDDIVVKGKFNVDFTGNNLDNFFGTAKVYDATLYEKKQKLSFDSLAINSYYLNNKKHLSIQTNELDIALIGYFQLAQLPDAFQVFLNKYFPSYIPKARKNLAEQDFSFKINTRKIDQYIALIDNRFKGFNNSSIEGNLNFSNNQLTILANIPLFSFKNVSFNNVDLKGYGGYDSLTVNTSISETTINDSLKFPNTKIDLKSIDDISDISIRTSSNEALNEADLSVRLQTFKDGFNLLFNPSSFVINNKKWVLEKGGNLSLNKNLFTASEVKFNQENQQIVISTTRSLNGSNDIAIDIKKLNIDDVVPFFLKYPRLEGLMTGKILITDPFQNLDINFNSQIQQFRFDNDSVGILNTSGSYFSKNKILQGKITSDNFFYNLTSDIRLDLNDSASNQLQINTILNNSDIHPLEKYISFLFTNIHGKANGSVNISGQFRQPKLNGSIRLNKTSFIVDYTKSKYSLADNSIMNFNGEVIDIPKIILHDTLNHVASISGKMYHKFFNNFYFEDLNFVTDHFANGQPGKFLLLNTTRKDNKDFYGHLVGDAHLSLNGPEDDMTMNITGEPTDSSHIYLPTAETAELGKVDYIDFIKFGREMKHDYILKKQANFKVNIDLDANPFAKIDVILDDVTGDVIKAQGTGKLKISVGSRDPLLIRGRYDILQGQYTFNFQTFLKTPFILQQGYIEWQGDPYLANMNIDAIYKARHVDLSAIVTSNSFNNIKNNIKGDIDILFKLRGTLKDPKPDFAFQFAFDNPLKSDPIANEFIKTRYQSDRNILNKEVTALLLFNSIIPDQENFLSGNNTGNFVTRSLGQVISNTLSTSLNNILKKVLKTDAVNLYTNINTADFNFQKSQRAVQNVGNFGLSTAFLKNRLLLNLGGNIDYNLQRLTNTNSNFLFTPDVSFEYYITPDGKFRVVGFNRNDAALGDVSGLTRRNRTGLLVSYHKDFNTFNELFGLNDKR